MPDLDPYVKSIQDLLGQLRSPADRIKAVEQAVAHLWQPEEARREAGELISGMAAMPGHLVKLQRLLAQFANPGVQLRSFQGQLTTTRRQLELMAQQMAAAEEMIGRFAELAEQLAALQEPFATFASGWGQGSASQAP